MLHLDLYCIWRSFHDRSAADFPEFSETSIYVCRRCILSCTANKGVTLMGRNNFDLCWKFESTRRGGDPDSVISTAQKTDSTSSEEGRDRKSSLGKLSHQRGCTI